MREGEPCIYQLYAPAWSSEKFIEIDITSVVNTKVLVYEGEEALTEGIASVVTTSPGLNQFDSGRAIYLVTEFTGNPFSCKIEYRRTSAPLFSEDLENTDELDSDTFDFKIEKEELYLILVLSVISLALVTLGIILCIKRRGRRDQLQAVIAHKSLDESLAARINAANKIDSRRCSIDTKE